MTAHMMRQDLFDWSAGCPQLVVIVLPNLLILEVIVLSKVAIS
jgi:hypothetical protein